MRKLFVYMAVAAAAILVAATSCTDEIVPATIGGTAGFTPKGELVDAYLDLTVSGLSVIAGTREVDADELEDDTGERTINDLWVFQYDATQEGDENRQLICYPHYLTVSDQTTLNQVPVRLSDNEGNESVVYIVTNTGTSTWTANSNDYADYLTIAKLKAVSIPTPKPQRMKWDYDAEEYTTIDGELSIPMQGCSEPVTVSLADATTVHVDVERMFAKLLMQVDLSKFNTEYTNPQIYNITVGDIPEYLPVYTQYNEDGTAGDYSGCKQWVTRAFAANESDSSDSGGDNTAVYPYAIYVPESILGVSGDQKKDKADNVPADGKPIYVAVDITAVNSEGVTVGPYTYTAYPGSTNYTDNFNIRRNCIYKLSVAIGDIEETDALIPSANCIVCLSGETTTFYPYYRVEEGGGYKFIDYLNYAYGDSYTDEESGATITPDESKRIDKVAILWQSENNEGGGGFIGNNEEGKLVRIDDAPSTVESTDDMSRQEKRRKIYVTIPAGETGNAVVAAYNSDGKIIWSWHIWSRTRAEDPSNEGNGVLYYTYDWDDNGIKYNEARIAGYTVMNCNLGALQDLPTNLKYDDYSSAVPTYGNFYQWGRKDPFPAVKNVPYASINTVYDKGAYNTSNVGNYYDNSNKQVQFDNSVDGDSDDYLFHTYTTTEVATKFTGEGVKYAIQHPTVFMIGQLSYTGVSNNRYCWSRDAFYGCTLWGGEDEDKKTYSKIYYPTLNVDASEQIRITDTYGTEKSIFDPCPYGWRVSPPDIWMGFTVTGENPVSSWDEVNYDASRSSASGFTMYMDEWRGRASSTSYFPIQGALHNNGQVYRVNTCGNYTNAIVDNRHYVNVTHFHDDIGQFKVFSDDCRYTSLGAPVRCVRFGSVSN